MKFTQIYLLTLFTLFGCKFNNHNGGINYLNDPTLSTPTGILLDSTKSFLPQRYYRDTSSTDSTFSLFEQKWFAANYRCFKAPVLYNYYLGYENYRFLWIRSFHRPVLITIEKKDKIEIHTRILEKHPDFFTRIYFPPKSRGIFSNILHSHMDAAYERKQNPNADSIVAPLFNEKVVTDTTVLLSQQQWKKFRCYIDSCSFWQIDPPKDRFIIDGAEWILEGQVRNRYQYYYRKSPDDIFKRCCIYLIGLSAAKDEDVY